jgi:hypothetical protein
MPSLIRPTTDIDLDWVKPLVDAAHPEALTEEQVELMLTDPKSVSYGEPTVPTFCCCTYQDIPEGHAVAAGMSTQVAYLLPLQVNEAYLREVIMPLLAKTLYEVGRTFPTALADPLWAQLDERLAALFETIVGTSRRGRVVTLPTLQDFIDKVALWL